MRGEFEIYRLPSRFTMALRQFRRETTPIPDSLRLLWPTYQLNSPVEIAEDSGCLYRRFLHADKVREESHPGGLAGDFSLHFHTYRLADLGLGSGAMTYKQAREYLYEALASQKDGLTDIYIFWMQTLKGFIEREQKHGGSIAAMEAGSDRITLEQKILESIDLNSSPIEQAYYTALFISSDPNIGQEERRQMMKTATYKLLRILPDPIDFSRLYHRTGDKFKNPRNLSRSHRYRPHENDLYLLLVFEQIGQKYGFGSMDAKDNQPGGVIGDLQEYLLEVLRIYDPAFGNPYITGQLLHFALHDVVPRSLRNYFRGRVKSALPAFGHGLHGQETLLEAIIESEVNLGNIRTAYRTFSKIREQTTMNLAVHDLMTWETLHGDPRQIEKLYAEVVAPLIANKLNVNAQEVRMDKSRIAEHYRHTWLFQWMLVGTHLAEDGDYSIFSLRDVNRYIQSGCVDYFLSMLARVCTDADKSRSLNQEVIARIQAIFNRENEGKKKTDGYVDSDDMHEALKALLILRSKNIS